jgi:hypothetical protein
MKQLLLASAMMPFIALNAFAQEPKPKAVPCTVTTEWHVDNPNESDSQPTSTRIAFGSAVQQIVISYSSGVIDENPTHSPDVRIQVSTAGKVSQSNISPGESKSVTGDTVDIICLHGHKAHAKGTYTVVMGP